MARADVIAHITSQLASAPDELLEALAWQLDAANQPPLRELTPHELALIEQSKEDFRVGRTYTLEESETYLDAKLAELRAARRQA
jgi:hypothetical protein